MVSFTTTPLPVTTPVVDRLELLRSQEELHQAWQDLTEIQRSMTEVQEIMENIQTSIDALTKYGQAAVEQLNVTGSLEALLQVPAKLITVEKAQEGLSDAAKDAWERIKAFFAKIVTFFRKLLAKWNVSKGNFDKAIKRVDDNILKKVTSRTTDGLVYDDQGYFWTRMKSVIDPSDYLLKLCDRLLELVRSPNKDNLHKSREFCNDIYAATEEGRYKINRMENLHFRSADELKKLYSNCQKLIDCISKITETVNTTINNGNLEFILSRGSSATPVAGISEASDYHEYSYNGKKDIIAIGKAMSHLMPDIERTRKCICSILVFIFKDQMTNDPADSSSRYFTADDLKDAVSCKVRMLKIIDEVREGYRPYMYGLYAIYELKRLKPDVLEDDDSSISGDIKDVDIDEVMSALQTNFSEEKLKIALAKAQNIGHNSKYT